MAKIICSIGNGIDWCGHESDGADDSLPLCSRHRKLINEPLREQIKREIKQHCIDIGHWHEPNMPCQVHERAAAIAGGNG